jgi:uncharacterized membrane protein (DUF373 family)
MLKTFKRGIVMALLRLMMRAVLASIIELAIMLCQLLMRPPVFLLNPEEMTEVLGFFLMVLIGLKLLETIKASLDKGRVHVEVVFLIAIVAAAQKLLFWIIKP